MNSSVPNCPVHLVVSIPPGEGGNDLCVQWATCIPAARGLVVASLRSIYIYCHWANSGTIAQVATLATYRLYTG